MKKIFLLVSFLVFGLGFGQNFSPTDRDPSFNQFQMPLNHYYIDSNINKVIVQSDGKTIIRHGDKKLVRLQENNLDAVISSRFNADVTDFALQSDGKIIVIGKFTTCDGITHRKIVRLNSDLTIDNTFLSGNGFYSSSLLNSTTTGLTNVFIQPDGKILINTDASINTYNGTTLNSSFIRLNSNGTLDATFNATNSNVGGFIENCVFQPDGKMFIFSNSSNGIIRLNVNGSIDTAFNVGTGVNQGGYKSLVCLPDGKIIIGGSFTSFNGVAKNRIVRLNNDGSIDNSFLGNLVNPNSSNVEVSQLQIDSSGRILVALNYNSLIIRLLSNGENDTSFNTFTGSVAVNLSALLCKIVLQPDGKILCYNGDAILFNNRAFDKIIRFNVDGTRDNSFNNFCKGFNNTVQSITQQPDGRLVIGGTFTTYNGVDVISLARLNIDGTLDNAFNLNIGAKMSYASAISALEILNSGKIVVGGNFLWNQIPSSSANFIVLNSNGTRSSGWSIGQGMVNDAIKLSNGKFVLVGDFTGRVKRYNADATFDPTFSFTEDFQFVNSVVAQSNNKVIISGAANNGGNNIIRLNDNGSKDTTYNSATSIGTSAIEIQSDDKLIVGATNTNSQGFLSSLIRQNTNGSIDTSFNFNDYFQSFILKKASNGKILVCKINPNYSNSIIRIMQNGTIDNTYISTPIFNKGINALYIQNDGKIICGGEFTTYKGLQERHITRLMGQDYYYVIGNSLFDYDSNGCSIADPIFPNINLNITSGSVAYNYITDFSGDYSIPNPQGDYTITPTFENPSYFTVSPTNISVSFPTQPSPVIQDFCITPNGVHPDLEITLLPLTVARPGFQAKYRLVYKNKGNQLQSGTVNFNFNDAVLNFLTATTSVSSQTLNNLNWNFNNLMPLETREITITLNVNSPTSTPPVTSGFVLNYTTSVSSTLTDEMPSDNTFTFNQTVVNSFDPNDKTCLEGATVATTKVGDYVHYMIRFENTGSYNAQNITVKDVIDTAKYDINTLLPTSGSHSFITRILEGNRAEFYFENINLPFADATNDGYVAFKIKTKSTLVAGDSFSNSAGIYFDYNYPITTNTATTTITALSNQDFTFNDYFSVYPNPVENNLNISKKEEIEISSIIIYNMLGQIVVAIPNAKNVETVDVSSLKSGNYFVKINSDKGNSNTKFIKL